MNRIIPRRMASSSTRAVLTCAALIYVLSRLVSTAVISWIANHQDPTGITDNTKSYTSYWDMTRIWDGEWYRQIVLHGYPHHVPVDGSGKPQQNPLAFYPLYPMIVRGLIAVTGGSYTVLAGLFSGICGLLAVLVMALLLVRRVSPRATLGAIALFCFSPPSPSLQMAYTESLALFLLAAILLALEREWWWGVGALAIAIGYERPIGVPLALVALVAVGLRIRDRKRRPIEAPTWVAMGCALIASGISGYVWPLTTWAITGERDAYSRTMATWRPGGKITPFEPWWQVSNVLFTKPWGPVFLVTLVVVFFALILGPWATRLGPILRVWCAAYGLYLFAVLEPWTSTYRYLQELFPLGAVLIGGAWARMRGDERSRELVLPVLTLAFVCFSVAGQLYWAWHYLRFVPPAGNPI